MTDYGHDLLFGSFITPSARQPQQVVALARLSEELGLDLVSFQDHPYQPAFLDTWTLLSYVAAATTRIRLAANVLNLPLRPPVGTARAAASLDLLSGGRVELGLGAGAFWDAIEANGGRRLAPGEAVVALDEAIRVIREVWATDRPGGVRVDGAHHRVVGAKRGPAPAHDMGIWVGGFGSLIVAKHQGIVSLGFVMAVGVSVSILAGLVSLPALLVLGRPGETAGGEKEPSDTNARVPLGREEPRD